MAGAERRGGGGEPRDRGAQTKDRSRAGAGHLSSVGLDGDGIERGEPGRSRRSAVEECASRRARTCCWFAPGWRYSVRSCRIWFTPSCCGCHRAGGGGGAAMVATGPAAVPAGSGVRVRCGVRDDARGGARSGCLARGRSSRGATTCGRVGALKVLRSAGGARDHHPDPTVDFFGSPGMRVTSARRAISHRIPVDSRRPNRRFLVRVYSAPRAARHHLGKAADVFLVAAEKQENGR